MYNKYNKHIIKSNLIHMHTKCIKLTRESKDNIIFYFIINLSFVEILIYSVQIKYKFIFSVMF